MSNHLFNASHLLRPVSKGRTPIIVSFKALYNEFNGFL